ncbi:MAG TPA: CHRD domain-containing protein [Isosphaeraceae bacterium]|nr:CHRD domain-containing protein [Isosphaeraceae bacterium]
MNRYLFGPVMLALVLTALPESSPGSPVVYEATLTGPNESPPNASPGIGSATVTFDLTAHSMHVQVAFSGLLGTTTASHIHAATASPGTGTAIVATQIPTFSGFPLGVTSGTYDMTFDTGLTATYNPAFITANGGTAASAESALAASLAAGTAYLNIHTTVVPGGEIRGFLTPVPEPSSVVLVSVGILGLVALTAVHTRVAPGKRGQAPAP